MFLILISFRSYDALNLSVGVYKSERSQKALDGCVECFIRGGFIQERADKHNDR